MSYTQTVDAGGIAITWPALANAAAGDAVSPLPCRGATFEATGTFGSGGSVQIEGSNDGVNFYKLSPAALTAAGVFATGTMELTKFMRPHVTAGDGTTAIVVAGRFNF